MLEKQVEKKCGDIAKRRGCLWFKWSSPSTKGIPDRICILPGGKVLFVELKRPGGKPTKLQAAMIRKLEKQGCDAYVVDNTAQWEGILDAYLG